MTPEQQVEIDSVLIKNYFEIWNTGSLALAQEIISPDFISRFDDRGPEGFIDTVRRRHEAFKDTHFEVTEIFPVIIGSGDYIVWFGFSGEYQGRALDEKAIGKKVSFPGVAMYRVRNGKIIGFPLYFDADNKLPEQLGVPIPSDRNREF